MISYSVKIVQVQLNRRFFVFFFSGATGEVDYNKKIVFSDEEDGTDSGGSAGRNERRKMYNSGVPGDNMRFRGGANKENFTPKVRKQPFPRSMT